MTVPMVLLVLSQMVKTVFDMDYDFTGKDSLHMNVFVYGGVACLYLDDEVALTARMYRSSGTNWQFFGINSPVQWDNVNIYN